MIMPGEDSNTGHLTFLIFYQKNKSIMKVSSTGYPLVGGRDTPII